MKKIVCCIIAAVVMFQLTGCALQPQDASDVQAEKISQDARNISQGASDTDAQNISQNASDPDAQNISQEAYDMKMEKLTQNAIDEFLKITKVPRPSFHLDRIREYLIQYAEAHAFAWERDDYGNFWMDIPASEGNENVPKVILQAHMDMVCAAESDYDIDFETTGITAIQKGNTITADRTSLGADNGIGIAIIMAIITGDISHGPIRALITADEDVGLLGAAELPEKALDAEYLINIDDEETNEIVCSSAGALRGKFEKQYRAGKPSAGYDVISFTIDGLLGGHSGSDIDKNRLSANVVLREILNAIHEEKIPFEIGSIDGGTAQNAIAPHAKATIAVPADDAQKVETILQAVSDRLKTEYPKEDLEITLCGNESGDAAVTTDKGAGDASAAEGTGDVTFISCEDSLEYLSILSTLPQGVLAMSPKIDGLVQTSSNIGILTVDHGKCILMVSTRSCVTEDLEQLHLQFDALCEKTGYTFSVDVNYPGWDGDPDTELIKIISAGYKKATGADTQIVPIHAGIECSWFARKHEGIQLASIGPKIDNPHTVNETLYIDTVRPCIEATVYALEKIASEAK